MPRLDGIDAARRILDEAEPLLPPVVHQWLAAEILHSSQEIQRCVQHYLGFKPAFGADHKSVHTVSVIPHNAEVCEWHVNEVISLWAARVCVTDVVTDHREYVSAQYFLGR